MPHDYHTPVLVGEVLRYLCTSPDGIYVDGTLGGGGHAEQILKTISSRGTLIGFDLDPESITYSQKRLERFGRQVTLVTENYVYARNQLLAMGIKRINGVLLDLGVSSHQIDEEQRGFSFQSNSRLDMRMKTTQALDGWQVVNTYDEPTLANLFYRYGEERNARRIAKSVLKARNLRSINTTGELAEVIESVIGRRWLTKTLARVFQAIRIEVNNELDNLQQFLADGLDMLERGGRIVVISYHSLEDRIVKNFFRMEADRILRSGHRLAPPQTRQPRIVVLTPKPITASEAELQVNPRARSAKLRAAERI